MVQEEQSRQMIWLIPFYVWRAVQGLCSTCVVCHEELELHTYIHMHFDIKMILQSVLLATVHQAENVFPCIT